MNESVIVLKWLSVPANADKIATLSLSKCEYNFVKTSCGMIRIDNVADFFKIGESWYKIVES